MKFTGALVEQQTTRERHTNTPWIKELLGGDLSNFLYVFSFSWPEANTYGVVGAGFAYHPEAPDNVFPYFVVDWTSDKWTKFKIAGRKEQLVIEAEEKKMRLEEKGLVKKSNLDKMKETQAKVLGAILDCGGKIGEGLAREGVSMAQHVRWKQTDQEYRDAMAVVREVTVDSAESVILDAVADGDTSAASWLLSKVGQSRGYAAREHTQEDLHRTKEEDLPIEALTIQEQKELARLINKMENYNAIE